MGVPVEIDNWKDLWTCQHEREDKKNEWAGIIAGAVGLLLIPKYLKKYKETHRRMRDIAERSQKMSLTLKDHYIGVTHPQIVHAISSALDMPMTELGISCPLYDAKAMLRVNKSHEMGESLRRRFTCSDKSECDNSDELFGAIAATDSAYAREQFNRRRFERRMEFKRGVVEKAHSATMQSPGPIFQLLQNAAGIYSDLFSNAQTNLAGASASFGNGLGASSSFFGGA